MCARTQYPASIGAFTFLSQFPRYACVYVQVQEKYERKHPHCEWRYELRVRYLPQNLNDLYEKDKVTFYYYYDQVRRSN